MLVAALSTAEMKALTAVIPTAASRAVGRGRLGERSSPPNFLYIYVIIYK